MPRRLAHHVLLRISRDGAFSQLALNSALVETQLSGVDRALATRIVYGTLTWQRRLDQILARHTKPSIASLDLECLVLLRSAVFQLEYLDRVPDYAVVDETVELAKTQLGNPIGRFVNAVLRGAISGRPHAPPQRHDRAKKPAISIGARYSLPNWIANRLCQTYGVDKAEKYAEGLTDLPPLYLRSTVSYDRDKVKAVDGVPDAWLADGWTDEIRSDLTEGELQVQDLGSQLIGHFCGATPGQRALDGCAGLGGKTFVLASTAEEVVAVDPFRAKLDELEAGASRLGLEKRITTWCGALADFSLEGPPDEAFDVVLVDAPCSGLGVLRRHPETKWTRKESDITALVGNQRALLEAAGKLVRPGGILIYAVCTFTSEEGPKQASKFLENNPDFMAVGPPENGMDWSVWTDHTGALSLTPIDHGTDGFYAARFLRRS
jgi:16S rRNA (cytosine967-C5)-methyltransferase